MPQFCPSLWAFIRVIKYASLSAGSFLDAPSPQILRPYLGVEVMDTGSEVIVKNILPGGGADEAGVQVNDILLKWNGQPIASRTGIWQ